MQHTSPAAALLNPGCMQQGDMPRALAFSRSEEWEFVAEGNRHITFRRRTFSEEGVDSAPGGAAEEDHKWAADLVADSSPAAPLSGAVLRLDKRRLQEACRMVGPWEEFAASCRSQGGSGLRQQPSPFCGC